ncbi:conserved Plasmodium protein, unknown function [Plasmodium relictum]|uniref:PUB domain-containing protein n=1 Tax=Plasmodium relictum TaxID=85471 RepID=A0A1J1H7X6_PLARL|nr:conserved Plasmodium protein, unknown function [Plasmodium relictum]CRG99528.1 conserved Plasmodium protein, unknown function [Plasmodium relictum]
MDEQNKLIEQMQDLGYSWELSVKVIKKSGAKTIDEILNWIELTEKNEVYNNPEEAKDDNQNDANEKDMNSSENMNKDNLVGMAENKTKLSPGEAQKKALELQKKIREKKLIKEKEEEIQKEKKRIAMAKEIQKRREQLEEYERKKYIETLEREKNEHKKEKQKQLELLKREYEAKFGIEYKHEVKKSIEELTENERREEIAILLNNLKNKNKDKKKELISSLNILKTYFSNIKDNILEKKYQKIKKENKIFVEKIKIYEEMLKIFLLVGFEDTGDFYVIKNYPNTYLLSSAMKFIDLIIKTLNQ